MSDVPHVKSKWSIVEKYLKKNGVEYPWTPRQTLKALIERDIAMEALGKALSLLEGAGQEHLADYVRNNMAAQQLSTGLVK